MRIALLAVFFVLASQLASAAVIQSDGDSPVKIDTKKVAHVKDVINDYAYLKFQEEMQNTAEIPGDRVLLIDSPGGSVDAGNQYLSLIEAERAAGTRIVCVAMTWTASMAFNILSQCDVRLAIATAQLLFHKAAYNALPWNPRLTAKQLRDYAAELDAVDAPFRETNAKAMGMSLDEYDFYADNDTRWTTGVLRKLGYLHGIATVHE